MVQHRFGKIHFLGSQTGFLQPSRPEVPQGDFAFLPLAVSIQPDDFHTVEQGLRERLQRIRRCDEKHFRQIERQIQIVVPERMVLRRVQNLQ